MSSAYAYDDVYVTTLASSERYSVLVCIVYTREVSICICAVSLSLRCLLERRIAASKDSFLRLRRVLNYSVLRIFISQERASRKVKENAQESDKLTLLLIL